MSDARGAQQATQGNAHIDVIGAGVSGLTTALLLVERGHRVRVVAKARTPETTSDIAAAVWYPYRAGDADHARRWGRRSYDVFARLRDNAEAGVTWVHGVHLHRAADEPRPWWADEAHDVRAVPARELPEGFGAGWAFSTPIVEMPKYLRWLEARLLAAGVAIEAADVEDLAPWLRGAAVVVNCTGLGARSLVPDDSLYPVRGQVVRVEPGATNVYISTEDAPGGVAYVIPRPDCIVLGGTADEHAWDRTVDPGTSAAIRARCEALVAGIAIGARPLRGSGAPAGAPHHPPRARAPARGVARAQLRPRRRRRHPLLGLRGRRGASRRRVPRVIPSSPWLLEDLTAKVSTKGRPGRSLASFRT